MFVDRGLLWSVYFWSYGSSLIHFHFRFTSSDVPLEFVDRRMLKGTYALLSRDR
jgi:hypothetical protein